MSAGDNFPPSFSDCKVKSEAYADIEEVADCFYNRVAEKMNDQGKRRFDAAIGRTYDPVEEECVRLAESKGLELLDSGFSRISFASDPDPQPSTRNPDGPTAFEQCVFKFARTDRNVRNGDGREQMRNEINNYETLPAKLTEPQGRRPPVFNPIQDYDKNGYLWLTQPFCAPPGNSQAVNDRLNTAGYRVSDLHSDNIGTYKTLKESAIIDYGLEVEDLGSNTAEKDDLEAKLRKRGATDIARPDTKTLHFHPDMDLPGDERPQESIAKFSRDGLVRWVDVYFPLFDRSVITPAEMKAKMQESLNGVSRPGFRVEEYDNSPGSVVGANYYLKSTVPDGAPVFDMADFYAEIEEAYETEFNHLADPYGATNDPRPGDGPDLSGMGRDAVKGVEKMEGFGNIDPIAAWREALTAIGMRNVEEVTGPNGALRFNAPADAAAAAPLDRKSTIWWDSPARVQTIEYLASAIPASGDVFQGTRESAQEQARSVATDVKDKVSDITVDDAVTYLPSRGGKSESVYEVRYQIRGTGVQPITPEKAISALGALRLEHDVAFDGFTGI